MLKPIDKLRHEPTYWITENAEPTEAPAKALPTELETEAVVRKVFDEFVPLILEPVMNFL
jgi:hypothetical protein